MDAGTKMQCLIDEGSMYVVGIYVCSMCAFYSLLGQDTLVSHQLVCNLTNPLSRQSQAHD